MVNKSLEMVVGAVAAGLSKRHSVVDVKPQKELQAFGIRGKQVDQFKKRLYLTLSPEGAQTFVEFANLDISPSSTIKQVVATLPKTYHRALRLGRGNEVVSNVRAAVRTAVAQASKKHSVFEVSAEKKLSDLGLRGSKIPEIRVNLYKTLLPVGKNRPDLKDYLTGSGITAATTIKEISDKSLEIFRDLPGPRRRIPLTDRNASLPGSEGRKRKGGFGTPGTEGKPRKPGFPRPASNPPGPKKSKPLRGTPD
jgi:hypothetical protein